MKDFWSHLECSVKGQYFYLPRSCFGLHMLEILCLRFDQSGMTNGLFVSWPFLKFKVFSFRGKKRFGPRPDWSPLGV